MKLEGWRRSLGLILASAMVLTTVFVVGSMLTGGIGGGGAQSAAAASSCGRSHTVQRGEANYLRDYNFIYVGQTLCLPSEGGGTTTTTPTTAPQYPGAICVEGHKIDDAHNVLEGFTIVAETGGMVPMEAVTDSGGHFLFDDLTPGLWTFSEVVPRGWEPVTASEFQISLEYGHDGCYQIRFKNREVPIPACLLVAKADVATGMPLSGWEIEIKPYSSDSWQSGLTDTSGQVRFDGLEPGRWLVREVVQYPWETEDPLSGEAEVILYPQENEDDCYRFVFQNRRLPTGCVEGYKVDDHHQPLPGWGVCTAPAAAELPVFCTETGADGYFRFDDLTLGEWTLWEEVQEGWTPVTAQEFNVWVDDVEICKQVRFKNRAPDLCAEGYKLDDKGFGLEGWTIRAWAEELPDEVLVTTTDASGRYRICGLTLGTWVFEEERPAGWIALNGVRQEVDVVYPGPGNDVKAPIFRNAPPRGCIEGWKVDDFEVGLPMWNITVGNDDTGESWHRWTDGTGFFQVCGLPMGDYTVWEEMQVGWKPVSPPKLSVTLEASDDEIVAIVVFVNKQVERDICIDGYKKDAYDGAGLPNWQIKLLDTAGNLLATTTTDGTGYYSFGNLEPGNYFVEETVQDGWWSVSGSSQRVTVTFPPKHECDHVGFVNRQQSGQPSPCVAWHIVGTSETLSIISLRYGVPVSAIMASNGLTNPNFIWVGQRLCIPGG